jgi:hypothetical protein
MERASSLRGQHSVRGCHTLHERWRAARTAGEPKADLIDPA